MGSALRLPTVYLGATDVSEWMPIAHAPKGRSVDDRMQTVLIVGRYPMNGERTDIIESWWDTIDGKWVRWKHPFEPSFFMVPPDVPKTV